MPIIASAKKKMRQDKKRTQRNKRIMRVVKSAVRSALQKPTKKSVQNAYSAIDTAAKKHLYHPKKAARLKSQVARTKSIQPATNSPSTKRS